MNMIDLNIANLMAETNAFRTKNISTMTDLFQRVNVVRPIARSLPAAASAGLGSSTSSCWCQAIGANFSCAYCGRASSVAG